MARMLQIFSSTYYPKKIFFSLFFILSPVFVVFAAPPAVTTGSSSIKQNLEKQLEEPSKHQYYLDQLSKNDADFVSEQAHTDITKRRDIDVDHGKLVNRLTDLINNAENLPDDQRFKEQRDIVSIISAYLERLKEAKSNTISDEMVSKLMEEIKKDETFVKNQTEKRKTKGADEASELQPGINQANERLDKARNQLKAWGDVEYRLRNFHSLLGRMFDVLIGNHVPRNLFIPIGNAQGYAAEKTIKMQEEITESVKMAMGGQNSSILHLVGPSLGGMAQYFKQLEQELKNWKAILENRKKSEIKFLAQKTKELEKADESQKQPIQKEMEEANDNIQRLTEELQQEPQILTYFDSHGCTKQGEQTFKFPDDKRGTKVTEQRLYLSSFTKFLNKHFPKTKVPIIVDACRHVVGDGSKKYKKSAQTNINILYAANKEEGVPMFELVNAFKKISQKADKKYLDKNKLLEDLLKETGRGEIETVEPVEENLSQKTTNTTESSEEMKFEGSEGKETIITPDASTQKPSPQLLLGTAWSYNGRKEPSKGSSVITTPSVITSGQVIVIPTKTSVPVSQATVTLTFRDGSAPPVLVPVFISAGAISFTVPDNIPAGTATIAVSATCANGTTQQVSGTATVQGVQIEYAIKELLKQLKEKLGNSVHSLIKKAAGNYCDNIINGDPAARATLQNLVLDVLRDPEDKNKLSLLLDFIDKKCSNVRTNTLRTFIGTSVFTGSGIGAGISSSSSSSTGTTTETFTLTVALGGGEVGGSATLTPTVVYSGSSTALLHVIFTVDTGTGVLSVVRVLAGGVTLNATTTVTVGATGSSATITVGGTVVGTLVATNNGGNSITVSFTPGS